MSDASIHEMTPLIGERPSQAIPPILVLIVSGIITTAFTIFAVILFMVTDPKGGIAFGIATTIGFVVLLLSAICLTIVHRNACIRGVCAPSP